MSLSLKLLKKFLYRFYPITAEYKLIYTSVYLSGLRYNLDRIYMYISLALALAYQLTNYLSQDSHCHYLLELVLVYLVDEIVAWESK